MAHDWLSLLRTQTDRFAEVIGRGDLDATITFCLIDVLASRPADSPAWTLDERDPTVGLWRRRQVHETAIHAWDAAESCGEPQAIEPLLAWDGVKEVVEVGEALGERVGEPDELGGRGSSMRPCAH